MLAHHYLEALEYAKATGQDPADLAERGRLALREAGLRASELAAPAAATRFFEAALELWPVDDPERAELMVRGAEAAWWAGQTDLNSGALPPGTPHTQPVEPISPPRPSCSLRTSTGTRETTACPPTTSPAARALAEDLHALPHQGSRSSPGLAVSHALVRGRAGSRNRPGSTADGRDARPRRPPGRCAEQHRNRTGEQRATGAGSNSSSARSRSRAPRRTSTSTGGLSSTWR